MSLPLRFKLTKDVQAYSHHNGTHVIATGNSDRGCETCVQIWTASSSAGTQTSTFVFPSTSVCYIPYAHIALFIAVPARAGVMAPVLAVAVFVTALLAVAIMIAFFLLLPGLLALFTLATTTLILRVRIRV